MFRLFRTINIKNGMYPLVSVTVISVLEPTCSSVPVKDTTNYVQTAYLM